MMDDIDEPYTVCLPLELKDEHQRRYEEIRSWRRQFDSSGETAIYFDPAGEPRKGNRIAPGRRVYIGELIK